MLYYAHSKGEIKMKDTILQLMTISALVFFGSSILNVILNTIKSIITIKGSTTAAALVNAITFGFYTIVVKQISTFDLGITVPITIIANLLGVYLAKWILNLFKKDKLWRISCTVPFYKMKTALITDNLTKYGIESTTIPYENGSIIDIFSKTQGESELIKEIITKNDIKYTIYEIDKSL